MLRRRRSAARGAAALLVSLLTGTLATGAMGAVDVAAAAASESRAENAADAVAHAVAGLLAADADREHLSIAVQAGAFCEDQPVDVLPAEPACRRALGTASATALANRAVLVHLTVGPDPRDLHPQRGPGRLSTMVLVAVPRGLPILPARCPPAPGSGPDLCWAEAWSAAVEAG